MVVTFGTLVGGLGLFLLAISMITDGLKHAAGDQLKAILERWTTTRLRGVGSGILVTAVVQSSSAVTVATIGFVNAGLLSLPQALGVIYGTNVGTTMTGWIVAAVGFGFGIESFALPMIGVGMFARTLRPGTRVGDIGAALAGFGLFFVGIDLMKGAFEGFAIDLDLARVAAGGVGGLVLYVGLGVLMTVLTQSSSAAIAITLTAAAGGVLALDAAAATVIGANVGTTSTAALSVIGATANARRVAAAHVVFNLVTGAIALILLPFMLLLVSMTRDALGLDDVPAVSLALFHSIFNALGVVLMWPLTTRLAAWLSARFTTQAERLSRPQYLDANVLATPVLALEALNRELVRAGALTRDVIARSLADDVAPSRDLQQARGAIDDLCRQIVAFVPMIETARLPDAQKGNTPQALRIVGYFDEVIGLLDEHERRRADMAAIARPGVTDPIGRFKRQVVKHVLQADPSDATIADGRIEPEYRELHADWRRLKAVLLEAASNGTVPVDRLNLALEGLRGALRMAEQMTKAALRMRALLEPAARQGEGSDPFSLQEKRSDPA